MEQITRSYPGLVLAAAMLVERLWFPLAVIVGLVGGALIGAELMQLQAPVVPAIQ